MRRLDSGWRDKTLADRHQLLGFDSPAAGMELPMVEYDRGEPVAIMNYLPRNLPLPNGPQAVATYEAFGRLHRDTGEQLPFFTVQYDVRNWAFRLFGHNEPAQDFLRGAGTPWVRMTEWQFVNALYRLRGRYMPDLAPFGVDFSTDPWIETEPSPEPLVERWPGQLMSRRRREHEPVTQVRASWRNPCVDIDLAVVDMDRQVTAIVDYKAPGAKPNLASTNVAALSSLRVRQPQQSWTMPVPCFVTCYEPEPDGWLFHVAPVNPAARNLLSYALSVTKDNERLARVIAGEGEWYDLAEDEWRGVLNCARYV